MMFSKSTFLVAVWALSNVVAATPPACLLAAVNTQSNVNDLQSICGSQASYVEGQIKKLCGSQSGLAMQAFQQSCKEAGESVSAPKPKPSTSSEKATPSHSRPRPTGPPDHSSKQSSPHTTTEQNNKPSKTGSGGSSSTAKAGKTSELHHPVASVTSAASHHAYTYSPPAGTGGMTTSKYSGNGTYTGKPSSPPTSASPSGMPSGTHSVPTNAAGRVEVGALMAMVAAGFVAAL